MADTIAPLIDRLDVAEARLASLSRMPYPPGRTDPDPGSEETWDAARVWAHISEFLHYWTAQSRAVVEAGAGALPPFGRVATDQARIDAIDHDRHLPREKLWLRVHDGIQEARAWFLQLSGDKLEILGRHPTRGAVPVRFVLEQFLVKHLEEHAAQLEKLAEPVRPAA